MLPLPNRPASPGRRPRRRQILFYPHHVTSIFLVSKPYNLLSLPVYAFDGSAVLHHADIAAGHDLVAAAQVALTTDRRFIVLHALHRQDRSRAQSRRPLPVVTSPSFSITARRMLVGGPGRFVPSTSCLRGITAGRGGASFVACECGNMTARTRRTEADRAPYALRRQGRSTRHARSRTAIRLSNARYRGHSGTLA